MNPNSYPQIQTNQADINFVYSKLYKSPRYYSELLLKIKTKSAEIQSLFYNRAQRYVYKIIQRTRLERKPVRIVIVKARQTGISTGISSIIYHHTATRSNISSMISSHDQDSSNNIYGMYQLFYDRTDDTFKPMKKYSNRKELLFENPDDSKKSLHPGLNSRIIVETAKNTSVGRSFTLQNFHGTEVAYWEKPEEVMMGIEEAVPDKEGTLIALESTANGIGNYFHRKCEQASRKETAYQIIFIPWFWEPEYQVALRDVKIKTLCQHEKDEYGDEAKLLKDFNLSMQQLQWRRNKIENNFEGNVERFCQEYPSTWQEAFIFSGQPLFNVKTLMAMKDNCPEEIQRGHVILDKEKTTTIVPSSRGELKLWEGPIHNEVYTIGADVSEGVEGGDNAAIEVLNVRTMTQVAEWCGLIAPDDLAHVIFFLAQMYGNPLTGVEVNNHGLTTVVTLQNLKYWNQYRRIVFDSQKRKRRDALGWKTTANTKPLIIDGLRQAVKEGEIILNSKECIDEMLHYVLLSDGKMGATPGHHDDRVIAMAIALEMAKQSFVRNQVKEEIVLKSKFTFDYFDKMAEARHREANRIPRIGDRS